MKEIQKTKRRLTLFLIGGILLLAWITAVLFVIRDTFFAVRPEQEAAQDTENLSLGGGFSGRKAIYDRNLNEMAVTFKLTSVYARPLEIKDPEATVSRLAEVFGLDAKELLLELKSERSFVWLGRHLSEETIKEVQGLNMQGVYLIDEAQRFYPNGKVGAHVVGFVKDEHGLAGVESFYDNTLRQTATKNDSLVLEGEPRAHLILTMDFRIQSLVEQKLAKLLRDTGASTASMVVMEPSSGRILALANLPNYDPNAFWDYSTFARQNRAVDDLVFPGGIGRIFRLATIYDSGKKPVGVESAALEKITADDNAGNQEESGRHWVRVNDEVYVSPELVLPYGAALSEAALAEFADRLGFHQKSGIDLPYSGNSGTRLEATVEDSTMKDSSQVQTTTAVHLLTGFSRLVNGGFAVVPHVVGSFWDDEAGVEVGGKSMPLTRPILPATSKEILSLLKKESKIGPGASVVIESLVDHKKISSMMQARMNLEPTEIVDNSDEVMGAADKDQELPMEIIPETSGKVFHAVLLGVAPVHEPTISFVVVLDDARIDLDKSSPMREMVHSMVNKINKLAGEKPFRPSPEVLAARQGEIYANWQKSLSEAPDEQKISKSKLAQDNRMPDVTGVSLRKALQTLVPYGLEVKIVGSGQVVSQEPAPGQKLTKRSCLLKLKVVQ